jgi:hypothetical protein
MVDYGPPTQELPVRGERDQIANQLSKTGDVTEWENCSDSSFAKSGQVQPFEVIPIRYDVIRVCEPPECSIDA